MTFPTYIPGDGPCVLADGVLFVPGMTVYYASGLGWNSAISTDHWEPGLAPRDSGKGYEWAFFLPNRSMAGVAALFVSRTRGFSPEGI